MIKSSHREHDILGVKVSGTSKNEVLSFVVSSLRKKSKFFISTPNPEIIVAAQKDPALLKALNAADLALPDGVGLGVSPRVTGREMFESLLKVGDRLKLKIYLLGATPEVNKATISKIKEIYPQLKVAGTGDIQINNDGYSEIEKYRKKHIDIIRHINTFQPDLLFVAFGAPKQEKWVNNNFKKLNIGGVMVVGGALDYFAGKTIRPPGWMAAAGLEWLWRAILEPQRIPRIINAVVVFPFLLTKTKINHYLWQGGR